ncbi:N-acetyltransferase domain-containing protein [Fusarium keratoplasticum]|uniref:N-acetyltransferase domain-containing protein n=1 Tax=Fusarium keratoplasticum TaxID=1328300 RepID=A0ACC0QMH9_9HYPO|nr:N-acetyltransferase domain-containing protein [Fusarium keratoplasticum]KAI8660292.1 N-acetyltransferase domain-containing protein [Fusarium keratoplasticum]
MASIALRPATLADSDAISNIHYEALNRYHVFYAAFFQKHPRDIIRIADRGAIQDPGRTVVVAEEEGGEIVGFIIYQIANSNSNKSDEDTRDGPPLSISEPKEHLKELWDRFNERNAEMDKCKEEAIKGQKHYGTFPSTKAVECYLLTCSLEVLQLMVHPSHQRSGVGGRLLSSALAKADADSAPTLVTSSAEGHGLYLRNGFRSLGKTWPVDNARWAGEAAKLDEKLGPDFVAACSDLYEEEDCMIRQPSFRR